MLNPGPNFRRITCPECRKGKIVIASGTARLQCSRLRQVIDGFKVGNCDFATWDTAEIPVEPGERFVVLDFTPFAQLTTS
ncbi:hypothetical protein [Streptomyces anulatus]|uniref:hypothetical protein n=1 Tax=Streptomyces anulatus TaxID=1892 RepID=UPI001C25E79B|nr:hypothetical protein [Streptomyces anulatus]